MFSCRFDLWLKNSSVSTRVLWRPRQAIPGVLYLFLCAYFKHPLNLSVSTCLIASTIRSPLHYPSGHTKPGRCRTDVDTTSHSNNVGATLPGCPVANSCLTYISLSGNRITSLDKELPLVGGGEFSRVNVEAFRRRPLTQNKKKKKKKKKQQKRKKERGKRKTSIYMSNYICM